MIIDAIKTRILNPPKDDLFSVIENSVSEIKENSILVVASKVVSIDEGRCIPISEIEDKDTLVIEEADKHLLHFIFGDKEVRRTIKHNTLLASAGIDESNADGHYILLPENPKKSAGEIRNFLKKEYKVKNVGVLIVDSMASPLRRGTLGISIGFAGFHPVFDYRDKKDLFERNLKTSQKNIADGLAAAAIVVMGEGDERTPLALISEVPFVKFLDKPMYSDKPQSSFEVPLEEDLFAPFLEAVPWQKGGGGKKI